MKDSTILNFMHLKNSNQNSACDMWLYEKATSLLSLLYKQILQSVTVFKQLFLRKKRTRTFYRFVYFRGREIDVFH